jgi:hypothetical protein
MTVECGVQVAWFVCGKSSVCENGDFVGDSARNMQPMYFATTGVMWSNFHVPVTTRAREFWTICSLAMLAWVVPQHLSIGPLGGGRQERT